MFSGSAYWLLYPVHYSAYSLWIRLPISIRERIGGGRTVVSKSVEQKSFTLSSKWDIFNPRAKFSFYIRMQNNKKISQTSCTTEHVHVCEIIHVLQQAWKLQVVAGIFLRFTSRKQWLVLPRTKARRPLFLKKSKKKKKADRSSQTNDQLWKKRHLDTLLLKLFKSWARKNSTDKERLFQSL